MIFEAIADALFALASALFGWLSDHLPDAPSWAEDLGDALAQVLGVIPEPVRWFFPLQPAAVAGLALAGLILAAGLLRLVRRVVSLFTGGGGNA